MEFGAVFFFLKSGCPRGRCLSLIQRYFLSTRFTHISRSTRGTHNSFYNPIESCHEKRSCTCAGGRRRGVRRPRFGCCTCGAVLHAPRRRHRRPCTISGPVGERPRRSPHGRTGDQPSSFFTCPKLAVGPHTHTTLDTHAPGSAGCAIGLPCALALVAAWGWRVRSAAPVARERCALSRVGWPP